MSLLIKLNNSNIKRASLQQFLEKKEDLQFWGRSGKSNDICKEQKKSQESLAT